MSAESISAARLASQVRPEDEAGILAATEAKLADRRLHAASSLLHNVRLLFRMLRDRTFHLTWGSRAAILGALVYFVLPTDATPDFLPGVGYIDDTVIVSIVIKRLAAEIERYKEHKLLHS
jgi:uncharacterized membrane protein YkvA (DUF1232 family)